MHGLETKISREMAETGIVSSGDHLLVAVSGGSDSIGLLYILSALKGEFALTLTAAYVDHGLRSPEETAGERSLVETAAMELGAGFCTQSVRVREFAVANGLSIEGAARDLRYGFLAEAAARHGCTKIAVAHTADDQAEELLLRLIRGTGRSGLAGMSRVNFRKVVRPLLATPKGDVLAYLAERHIPYLEDRSNTERVFLRNRVRLELLPYLAENFNPAIRETLLRTADILGAEEAILVRLTKDVYDSVVREEGAEHLVIDCPAMADQELALQRRVVEQVLTELSSPVTFQQVEKILELAAKGNGGAELHLSEGLRVVRNGGKVALSYPVGRTRQRGQLGQKSEGFLVELKGPGSWPVPELSVNIDLAVLSEPPGKEECFAGRADYLDMRSFDFPLQVRAPKAGDRFRPLRGPGSKKVADFLADRKIGAEARRRVPVLVTGDTVLALLGIRIDDRHRLLADSGKVLKVEIRRW